MFMVYLRNGQEVSGYNTAGVEAVGRVGKGLIGYSWVGREGNVWVLF